MPAPRADGKFSGPLLDTLSNLWRPSSRLWCVGKAYDRLCCGLMKHRELGRPSPTRRVPSCPEFLGNYLTEQVTSWRAVHIISLTTHTLSSCPEFPGNCVNGTRAVNFLKYQPALSFRISETPGLSSCRRLPGALCSLRAKR